MTPKKLPSRDDLPAAAFAIVGEPAQPRSWRLPHHKRSIYRAMKGNLDIEKTVDWDKMEAAVAALSFRGHRGRGIAASPEEILRAARHLAEHYRKAKKALPDALAALG